MREVRRGLRPLESRPRRRVVMAISSRNSPRPSPSRRARCRRSAHTTRRQQRTACHEDRTGAGHQSRTRRPPRLGVSRRTSARRPRRRRSRRHARPPGIDESARAWFSAVLAERLRVSIVTVRPLPIERSSPTWRPKRPGAVPTSKRSRMSSTNSAPMSSGSPRRKPRLPVTVRRSRRSGGTAFRCRPGRHRGPWRAGRPSRRDRARQERIGPPPGQAHRTRAEASGSRSGRSSATSRPRRPMTKRSCSSQPTRWPSPPVRSPRSRPPPARPNKSTPRPIIIAGSPVPKR